MSADWPAGESCVPEEAGGAAGRSPLRGVPEEAAGDAPSAPAQGGDGRRLQGKKGDTNRKEKCGLEFLVRPNVYQAESRHGAWRDSVAPMHVARLHVSCLAAGVPAWQLSRAKACGATLALARLFRESRHGAWRDQKG